MTADTPKLVCFGNLTLDDIVPPGGMLRARCIGGDALYGVLAARLFEPRCEMVAPVGCDFPHDIRARITAAGLSTAGLPARPCPTLHTLFRYETAEHRIVTLLSDPADFELLSPHPEDVPDAYWGAGGVMILAMTLAAQKDLIAAWRARTRATVALDLQEEYIAGNEALVLGVASQADVLMPSLAEVRLLLGHEDAARAAQYFASLGPRLVVIKMGEAGCLVHDARSGAMFIQPALAAMPVDTTGCGDAFCSAFMARLVGSSGSLSEAAAAGTIAARFALSAYGADALFRAAPADAVRRCGLLAPPRFLA